MSNANKKQNKKNSKLPNIGHGTIYCKSMLLPTVENDALAMKLALWMRVLTMAPQLPKPKSSYKKP